MTTGAEKGTTDLLDVLSQEEDAIAALSAQLEAPASRTDHVRRAALGMELLERVSLLDLTRHQVLEPALAKKGHRGLVDAMGSRAERRRPLMGLLGEMTSGVSARDVHVSEGSEFDVALEDLRAQVCDEIDMERRDVVPLLREGLSPAERAKLGARAAKALHHHEERSGVTRRLFSAVDRVRNFADTPHHSEHLE